MVAELLQTRSIRSLTVRYIVGLTLIAILSIGSYHIMENLVAGEQATAAIINISGRQRMLTQKTAMLTMQLTESQSPAEKQQLQAELKRSINLMLDSHHALINGRAAAGLPGGLSPEVRALLYEQPVMLEDKLYKYLNEINEFLGGRQTTEEKNARLPMIIGLANQLVDAWNLVVDQFQRESEARIATLRALVALVVTVMLAVLMLEALFIFQPVVLTLRRETDLLAEANAQLERLSNVDGLTGLANRRSFDSYLEREWQRAMREKQPLTLIMADVDHFKSFNDTYGHQAGDDCLRQIATVIREGASRATDLAARYGGEEFVVVLPGTETTGAAQVAEKIQASVVGLAIPHKASAAGGFVTISLGVAGIAAGKCASPAELIAAADQAMYEAKQKGRNQVRVADAPDKENSGS